MNIHTHTCTKFQKAVKHQEREREGEKDLRCSSFRALVAHITLGVHNPRHQPSRTRHRRRDGKSQARNEQVGDERRIVLTVIGVSALSAVQLVGGRVLFSLLGSSKGVWIADALNVVGAH